MTSNFDKDHFPIWCEGCDRQGFVFDDDPEHSCFVICKTCGWETSDVWCPKCGMGGDFIRNIHKRPSHWVCSNCKTKYQLPDRFYQDPISLFTVEDLPETLQEQIRKEIQANARKNLLQGLWALIKLLPVMIAYLVVFMLPMLLIFTPLPWTIPGFVIMLLVFIGWWWLVSRLVIIMRKGPKKQSS